MRRNSHQPRLGGRATLLLAAGAIAAMVPPSHAAAQPTTPQRLAPQTGADDPFDFNASASEYDWMTAGETFAALLVETCPQIVNGTELEVTTGLTDITGTPSFLRDYPGNARWFSADAAPRNVFISIDQVPDPRRCRVVLANNLMSGATHLMAGAMLRRRGARPISSGLEPRRNLRESVWILPEGDRALLFLIQTVPQPERAGRGWQGTATATRISRERAQRMGLRF